MQLTVAGREGNLVRLDCSGSITPLAAPEGADLWQAALGPVGYAATALLDLSHADYLDSTGVSWLIIAHRRFAAAGGRLILHSLPRRIQETVELLRLPAILNITADETAARALAGGVAP